MNMSRPTLKSITRLTLVALWGIATVLPLPSQAAFHLWQIREIYSNSAGDLQYIEMFCPDSGQTSLNGQQITAAKTFTLNHGISGDSLNHALLFGTAGIQARGAPAPDYILPNGFLFTPNGSISFFGANSASYSALPTDGTLSRVWGTANNSVNNPQNYAGQTGIIVVPEPTTWALLGMAALGYSFLLRRRSS